MTVAGAPPDRGRTAPRLATGLSWLLLAAVVAGSVWLVARDADAVATAARTVGLPAFVISAACGVAGTACLVGMWTALLRGSGIHPPRGDGAPVFFATQLGKYVPGAVWPIVAQMEAGRRWGATRSAMLAVNLQLLVVVTTTGLLTGAALLPWASQSVLADYWWAFWLLAPLIALLHPRAVAALLDVGLRLLGRPPLHLRLPWRTMAQAVLWSALMWLLMGLHMGVLVVALGASGWAAWASAAGSLALGWAAGLIVVPAPAGAGVREAVIVGSLVPLLGGAAALTVALASRVLLLLADVGLAALVVLVRTVRRPAAATSAPGREGSA